MASHPVLRQANVAGAARMQRERNPRLCGAKEDPATGRNLAGVARMQRERNPGLCAPKEDLRRSWGDPHKRTPRRTLWTLSLRGVIATKQSRNFNVL